MQPMRVLALALGSLLCVACGTDELRIQNRLDHLVTVNVQAAKAGLTGGCTTDFRTRFCDEEFESIGVLEIGALEETMLTVFEPKNENQCINIVWLKLMKIDDVGPVSDRGTLFELPSEAEIELGAGRIHTAAFPQGTVRIDEIGLRDANQGPPPPTCAELGREPQVPAPAE